MASTFGFTDRVYYCELAYAGGDDRPLANYAAIYLMTCEQYAMIDRKSYISSLAK